MNIAIEPLQLSELVAFLREQADDCFPDLKDEQRLNMLAEKWHRYAEFCLCRDDEGQLIGMIAFYVNQPENGVVYIPHVYVNRKCRGKKLMTSMLNSIKEYACDKGFQYMRLEVNKANRSAQIAYKHYGFSITGETSDKAFFMQYNIL